MVCCPGETAVCSGVVPMWDGEVQQLGVMVLGRCESACVGVMVQCLHGTARYVRVLSKLGSLGITEGQDCREADVRLREGLHGTTWAALVGFSIGQEV